MCNNPPNEKKYEIDPNKIFNGIKEAQKRKLKLPTPIQSQENINGYIDIVIALKLLKLFPNIEILTTFNLKTDISLNEFIEYLFDDEFISYEVNEETADYYFNKLTIPELKNILKNHNLKTSGKKQDLIDRIINNNELKLSKFKSEEILFTKKGLECLDEYYWIIDYRQILNKFYLQDFFSYQFGKEGEIKDISIDYLDEHLQIALNDLDFDYILDCLCAKSDIYKLYEDLDNYLEYQMKIFSLIINPSILSDFYISQGYKLKKEHLKEVYLLKKNFDENTILNSFEENWNFLNQKRFIIKKDDAKEILLQILSNENREKLIKHIYTDFFKTHDNPKVFKPKDNSNQKTLDNYFQNNDEKKMN